MTESGGASPRVPREPLVRAPADVDAGSARRPFILAHLSDPHVPTRLGGGSPALLNKRFFGYLSWRFRRSRIHRAEVLDALRRDLTRLRPDHVAVTGDIVNIALPHEFPRARDWLRTLGMPSEVTVVPGNHDAYVAMSWERSWAVWHDFMSSDAGSAETPPVGSRDFFPIFRRRGPIAVIGLSTAVPTAPGHASGRVGPVQLARAADHLRKAREEGLFRVVLLHHPPCAPGAPRHKRLTDARHFATVIREVGAELILHGHEHRFRLESMAGPHGQVPVLGVPSASMLPREDGGAAQYHLHHIEPRGDGWAVQTHVHTYSAKHGAFVESMRLQLVPAATGADHALPGSTPIHAV